MSGWKRCDQCRKVLAGDAFEGDAATCTACLTVPAPKVRAARATATVTRKVAPTAPPRAEAGPRLGAVGSGDLEVRERRAQRAATQQLVELHQEEFGQLLAAARRAEGLRA